MALTIKGNKGGDFTPPPEGLENAICVDVVDMGLNESTWEGKTKMHHEVRVVWFLESAMDDGQHFMISKWYNCGPDPDSLYMSPKSNIWKDLCSWRGREFTDEELEGFDIEAIIGKPCRILVTHYAKRDGSTGAKADRVMKAVPKQPMFDVSEYTRVKDREDSPAEETSDKPFEATEDDIPF